METSQKEAAECPGGNDIFLAGCKHHSHVFQTMLDRETPLAQTSSQQCACWQRHCLAPPKHIPHTLSDFDRKFLDYAELSRASAGTLCLALDDLIEHHAPNLFQVCPMQTNVSRVE